MDRVTLFLRIQRDWLGELIGRSCTTSHLLSEILSVVTRGGHHSWHLFLWKRSRDFLFKKLAVTLLHSFSVWLCDTGKLGKISFQVSYSSSQSTLIEQCLWKRFQKYDALKTWQHVQLFLSEHCQIQKCYFYKTWLSWGQNVETNDSNRWAFLSLESHCKGSAANASLPKKCGLPLCTTPTSHQSIIPHGWSNYAYELLQLQ